MTSQLRRKHLITARIHPAMPGSKMVGRSLAPALVLCLSLCLASDIVAQTSSANSVDPISASNVDEEAKTFWVSYESVGASYIASLSPLRA